MGREDLLVLIFVGSGVNSLSRTSSKKINSLPPRYGKLQTARACFIEEKKKNRNMTGKGGDAIRSPRWLSIEDRSLQEIYESVRELLLETLNEDEGWKGLTRDDISRSNRFPEG